MKTAQQVKNESVPSSVIRTRGKLAFAAYLSGLNNKHLQKLADGNVRLAVAN